MTKPICVGKINSFTLFIHSTAKVRETGKISLGKECNRK